jgi:hypothetical protein
MSTLHGRLSGQSAVRLQAGELILRGFANNAIIAILGVSLPRSPDEKCVPPEFRPGHSKQRSRKH